MTCEGCYFNEGCGWADDVREQAINGSGQPGGAWPRANWERYIARINEFKKQCKRPDLLDAAMRSAKPRFIGE